MPFALSLLANATPFSSHTLSPDPRLTWASALGLIVISVLSGAINSVAGGGSFLTFPALIFCGVTPIRANATNTLGLWLGNIASMGAYREQLAGERRALITFAVTSLLGGTLGSVLLLRTSDLTFKLLLPWLLLLATLIFVFGQHLTRFLRESVHLDIRHPHHPGPYLIGCLLQLIIATYGGFFGAGIGILMLALLALLGYENIHTMNGLKTVLATVINGISVVIFIGAGVIAWPQALVMMTGAILGGYYGAVLAQKISAQIIRQIVIVIAVSMTVYFFAVTYF